MLGSWWTWPQDLTTNEYDFYESNTPIKYFIHYPHKENNVTTLTVNAQTEANRKAAADIAKVRAKTSKAVLAIETATYGDNPYATLSGYNDQGGENDQNFYFKLDASDLEALQNAIYKARVELHKVANKISNPSLSSYTMYSL